MIHIYGDSHADFTFRNLNVPNKNIYNSGITMYRIGRDNSIYNYNSEEIDENSIIVLVYGEIDCRLHIQNQINVNLKNENDLINELVHNYFLTIYNNIKIYNKIIIVGIIPTCNYIEFTREHDPSYVLGTDEDRVRYTLKVNNLIESYCIKYNYIYFNPYNYYADIDGTLKNEFTAGVHLGKNDFFIEKFIELYEKIK